MELSKKNFSKKLLAILMSMAMIFAMSTPMVFADNVSQEKNGLDPGNLADGEYAVGIEMVKPGEQANVDTDNCGRSMANGAIKHDAKVIVRNGQPRLQMNFGYLDLFGKRGYLGKLYVNDEAFPESGRINDEYKKGYKDVDVISYVLDEDGNKYIDEYNDPNGEIAQQYPKCRVDYAETVEFNIPQYALNKPNGFVSCQVLVPVMESMGGFGTQQVLIRIMWDGGWTEVSQNKVEFAPLKAIKMYQSMEKDGATLTGILPVDSNLLVSKIDDDQEVNNLAAEKNLTVLNAYDVSLDKSLEEPVHLSLKVDNANDGDKVRILHVHDSKIVDDKECTVSNGNAGIDITSFSKFIIAKEKKEEPETPINPETPVNPETPSDPGSIGDKDLDFANLEDGIYSITGEMIKTNKKDKSMSNKGFDRNVKLRVENGKYFVTLSFKGINMGGKLGFLGKMKYYDDNGKLNNAKVVETVKYDGKTYPAKVELPLNTEGKTTGWQKLQVFVQAMEDIAKGCGTQDVYLKLDPKTVKSGFNPKASDFGDTKSTVVSGANNPKTGDETGSMAVLFMLAAGIATAGVVETRRRKENRR